MSYSTQQGRQDSAWPVKHSVSLDTRTFSYLLLTGRSPPIIPFFRPQQATRVQFVAAIHSHSHADNRIEAYECFEEYLRHSDIKNSSYYAESTGTCKQNNRPVKHWRFNKEQIITSLKSARPAARHAAIGHPGHRQVTPAG